MFKLSIQKIIVTGAGLAGGGSSFVYLQHHRHNNYHFANPFVAVVHAAEADGKAPVASRSSEDKYAALYAEPEPVPPKPPLSDKIPVVAKTRTEVEQAVEKCRTTITPIKDSIKKHANNTVDFTIRAADSTVERVNYIKHKAPKEVQIATIVGSGLAGLILSYRRGFFRKILYTSTGAGIASWIIYPAETKSFIKCSAAHIKKYTLVAYHFVVGAEPKSKDK